jgi:hypothetical protein
VQGSFGRGGLIAPVRPSVPEDDQIPAMAR